MTKLATPRTLKALLASSILYIIVALIAAMIAISQNIPAQPMGENSGTGRPVLEEFLMGNGTGMSAGLPWLAAQAVLTLLARCMGRWGAVGVAGLAIWGLLSGIFATTEPIFRRTFNPATFDPLKAVVEAAGIALAAGMVIFAVMEWLRRRRPG